MPRRNCNYPTRYSPSNSPRRVNRTRGSVRSGGGVALYPFDNQTIRIAVREWRDHYNDALAMYGHISRWDTSHVTDMNGLFKDFFTFDQPIGEWNTSNVSDMRGMFDGCESFDQPLNNWNTSKVTDMSSMFAVANAFNQPLGDWDTSQVTDMNDMFYHALAFNQPLNNLSLPNEDFGRRNKR